MNHDCVSAKHDRETNMERELVASHAFIYDTDCLFLPIFGVNLLARCSLSSLRFAIVLFIAREPKKRKTETVKRS